MFGRLLLQLLRGSRGRLGVALLALVSGAAVISALVNLDLGVEGKLTEEFRTLGANVVISAPRALQTKTLDAGTAAPAILDEWLAIGLEQDRSPEVVALAPYLYVVAHAGTGRSVVLAGTWLDQAQKLDPSWKLEGGWIASREDKSRCLIGRNAARQLQVVPGGQIELQSNSRTARLTVAGIVEAGSAEDNQIFVNLPVAQGLAGLSGGIQLVQLSVSGTETHIAAFVQELSARFPQLEVRPIRQIAEAEGQLLARIRLLILLMVFLILVLTGLCVLATMAALAMDRREDVGLMKALGGSVSRVVGLFMAEAGVLGAAGGILGYVAGIGLTLWMGRRVFAATISPRWEVFPLTVALMVGVALAGALPLRLLGRVKPAVILRGE